MFVVASPWWQLVAPVKARNAPTTSSSGRGGRGKGKAFERVLAISAGPERSLERPDFHEQKVVGGRRSPGALEHGQKSTVNRFHARGASATTGQPSASPTGARREGRRERGRGEGGKILPEEGRSPSALRASTATTTDKPLRVRPSARSTGLLRYGRKSLVPAGLERPYGRTFSVGRYGRLSAPLFACSRRRSSWHRAVR